MADDVLDDITRLAQKCERTATMAENLSDERIRLLDAVGDLDRAWSRSWIGYQARVYKYDLTPCRPGEHFDSHFTAERYSNRTTGEWAEFEFDAIVDEIKLRARVSNFDEFDRFAEDAEDVFSSVQGDLIPILAALTSSKSELPLEELRNQISELKSSFSQENLIRVQMPSQVMTSDHRAMQGGWQVPPHISVQTMLISKLSHGGQLTALAKLARQAVKYLQIKRKLKGISVAKTDGNIFIGHGGSPIWKDLRDFIRDDLELPFDEFNRDPTEGLSTKEVLQQKLDEACFALLVMTGEDDRDGKLYARQNVVHEAGLFQGRLGFERAIILLEGGCEEFSNKFGITHIPFPKGDVSAAFQKIRRVLKRERIIA